MKKPDGKNEPKLTLERADGSYRGYDVVVDPATFAELSKLTRQDILVSFNTPNTYPDKSDPRWRSNLFWERGSKAVKADTKDKNPTPRLTRGSDPWNIPGIDREAQVYSGETPTAAARALVEKLRPAEFHPFDRRLAENLDADAERGGVGSLNPNRLSLELRNVARERQERIVAELTDKIRKAIETKIFGQLQSFARCLKDHETNRLGIPPLDLNQPAALIERNVWSEKEDGPDNVQDSAQMLRYYWAERVLKWVRFEVETVLREKLEITGTIRRSRTERPGPSRPIRKDEFAPLVELKADQKRGNLQLSLRFADNSNTSSEGFIRELEVNGVQFTDGTAG